MNATLPCPWRAGAEGQGEVPYVIDRARKSGVRYTAMYTDENGRYKSAGTYDTQERAQRQTPATRE